VVEVIDGQATNVVETHGWNGEFPFFLVIEPRDQSFGNVGIDLDEPGWVERNKHVMRAPATWILYHKESSRPLFCVIVEEGDQPFFVKHHVGNLMAGSEVIAVGIGKKTVKGEVVNLWLLPNGVVCGGDDVDVVAGRILGG
jgi:hypothetical protein